MFENDVSAWDSSVCEKLCKLEVWIAKNFGAPRAVLDLMLANIDTHGRTTNGWSYRCKGTRKSGDPYTSCFNSLLNALMHLFVFHLQTGISTVDFSSSIRMMVMGDDNLMRHAGGKINFHDDILQLGFESVSRYRSNVWDVEFCSSTPVNVDGGFVFVPKIGKVFAKFGYFINPPVAVDSNSILRGVCIGFSKLRFLPFFDAFLQGVEKICGSAKPYFLKEMEHAFKFGAVRHCQETDSCVMMRYGFDTYMFNRCVVALRAGDMDHPFVKCLFDRETDER